MQNPFFNQKPCVVGDYHNTAFIGCGEGYEYAVQDFRNQVLKEAENIQCWAAGPIDFNPGFAGNSGKVIQYIVIGDKL